MDKLTIGDRLRQCRENAKITLEDAGKITGKSKQAIFKYEHNIVTNIPSDIIKSLSDLYHVSPGYIMGWEENPGWYDPEAAEIAQAMKDNPGMRVLLDASKHVSLETLKALAATIKTLAKKPDEEDYSQDPDDYPKK